MNLIIVTYVLNVLNFTLCQSQAEDCDIIFPEHKKGSPPSKHCHSTSYLAKGKGRKCIAGVCEDALDYPYEQMQKIKHKLAGYSNLFGNLDGTKILTTRVGEAEPISLCTPMVHTIYPKTLKNDKDVEKFIVNVGEHTQGLLLETCKEKATCMFSPLFPSTYTAQCTQRYATRRLMALNEDGNPAFDSFVVPSCCLCMVGAEKLKRDEKIFPFCWCTNHDRDSNLHRACSPENSFFGGIHRISTIAIHQSKLRLVGNSPAELILNATGTLGVIYFIDYLYLKFGEEKCDFHLFVQVKCTETDIIFPGEAIHAKNGFKNFSCVAVGKGRKCIQGVCEDAVDYPYEHIKIIKNKLSQYSNAFEFLDGSTIAFGVRQKPSESSAYPLCTTSVYTRFPKTLRNDKDMEKFIVNVEGHRQGLVFEICGKKSTCMFAPLFPETHVSECTQRYMTRRLMSLSDNGNPEYDSFVVPSCCMCMVREIKKQKT